MGSEKHGGNWQRRKAVVENGPEHEPIRMCTSLYDLTVLSCSRAVLYPFSLPFQGHQCCHRSTEDLKGASVDGRKEGFNMDAGLGRSMWGGSPELYGCRSGK